LRADESLFCPTETGRPRRPTWRNCSILVVGATRRRVDFPAVQVEFASPTVINHCNDRRTNAKVRSGMGRLFTGPGAPVFAPDTLVRAPHSVKRAGIPRLFGLPVHATATFGSRKRTFEATGPQPAHSNLCTARRRLVGCGAMAASFIGLRHLGQVSFINRSKDMVALLGDLPDAIRLKSKDVSGIASKRVCRPDWLPPKKRTVRATLPREGLSRAGVPNRSGSASGSDALLRYATEKCC
jgi:hypothetical protein